LDVVRVWQFNNDDSNGIVKLAIRILSIVANSGASERNFSAFGTIQTDCRNELSVERVHNVNVVRMEIRHSHAEAGLLISRGKRKLGSNGEPSSEAAEPDPTSGSDSDEDTFTPLAHRLIDSARDANDAHEDPPVPLARPSTCPKRTQVPLSALFDYEKLDHKLDFYWRGGLKNLEKDAEACELIFAQQQGMPQSTNQGAQPTASSAASTSSTAY
jgi:hAT family C-terminal dimerisation region